MSRLLIVLCGLLLSTPSLAQQVVVLDADLEPTTTSLDKVSLSDDGLVRIQIKPGPITPLNDKQYVATLVDGQVFIGTLLGVEQGGEALRLAFGYQQHSVVLPLDELLSFTRVGHRLAGDENDDTLLLATGETLVGFVDSIGEKNIGFVIGDADEPVPVPMQRVQGFSIANKPVPVLSEQGTARVLLRDGSLVLLREAALKQATENATARFEGTLAIRDKTQAIKLPILEVIQVEPLSAKHAMRRLTDLPMSLVDGGKVFSVDTPPRVTDDGSIKMHAPVTVGFELPEGARRLALNVAMDLDESIPESRRAMAGCELVVYEGDKVVGKHTLTPDGPAKRLNVPLTGGDLRIALEPGVNGPVLDRVLITRAELLVSE